MDFTALRECMQWALDAEYDQLLQIPCLPESWFQLDVDSSAYSVPTRMEDVQVAPEYDVSSVYPQPTAASGMVGLEGASNWYSSSPSSTSSSSDLVSMAINQAAVFEDFQLSESDDSSSYSPAQSVAEEYNAASRIIITPPQPLVFTVTVPDQGFVVNRESAGFEFKIEPGKKKNGMFVKHAPWTFSELMNKLFVDKDKTCPVTFKSTIPAQLQGQYRVVVYVAFAELQYVHKHIRRCPKHDDGDPESNPVLGCRHPDARAENRDGHHAVVVPLDVNNAGQLSAVARFTFSCLSTCSTIKNEKKQKRSLKLYFRLETRSGQMVDEKAVDLKLCASTGRDIMIEQNQFVLGK
jgi:P53 DNA-binding domain